MNSINFMKSVTFITNKPPLNLQELRQKDIKELTKDIKIVELELAANKAVEENKISKDKISIFNSKTYFFKEKNSNDNELRLILNFNSKVEISNKAIEPNDNAKLKSSQKSTSETMQLSARAINRKYDYSKAFKFDNLRNVFASMLSVNFRI